MKTKQTKIVFNLKKGFSIGEVLIALFVLTFGTIAAIYLMTGSMKDSMRARDLLIASMLSQEGTELVRNIRDNNVTEKGEDGVRREVFAGFPVSNGSCTVDYDYDVNTDNSPSFITKLKCSTSSYELFYKNTGGATFYTHESTSNPTRFKRKIIIESEGVGIKSVVSMVVWNGREFPNGTEDCSIGQNCVFTKTVLTAWLNFKD